MTNLTIETQTSSDGGLFFQSSLQFSETHLELPVTTTPVKAFTQTNQLGAEVRDITDIYHEVGRNELDRYRSGADVELLDRIERDLKYASDGEVVVVFLEYSEPGAISRADMETMLEIQAEFGDILTQPVHPAATQAIESDKEITVGWEDSTEPYAAYRDGLEEFIKLAEAYDHPAMASLAPIGYSRLREVVRICTANDVHLFAYDWRGRQPSLERNHRDIRNLLSHLVDTGEATDQVFYSLNHRNYHPEPEAITYPAEPLALVGMGFHVIGGSFRPAGGGGDPSQVLKILDPNEFEYVDLPMDASVESYPVNSTIDLEQIQHLSAGTNQTLRRIINAESLYHSLAKLRAAVSHGNTRAFLEAKEGYRGQVRETMEAFAASHGRDAKLRHFHGQASGQGVS